MTFFQVRIFEVENGFVIQEHAPNRLEYVQPMWVAQDIPELMSLVGDLAAKYAHQKEPNT
jgi:hypothetical protein